MQCRRLPLLLTLLAGLSLSGCYNTYKGYRSLPPSVAGRPFHRDARETRVALIRPKDCQDLSLAHDEAVLAIDPALGKHAAILVAGRGLVPKNKWGLFPSVEVRTGDQTLKGWLLELTDRSDLTCFDQIIPAEENNAGKNRKTDDKKLRAIWARWWQIVADGKAADYGVRASPVSGSIQVEGMESRYRKITLNLETDDAERRKIDSVVEYFLLYGAWM